jgi:N-acetylglucosamine-6-phosphate deacetylase
MRGKSTALRGDALINGRIVPDALIEMAPRGGESVITAVGPAGRRAAAARARRINGVIAPGYVDQHLHGAGGHDAIGPRGAQALIEATRGGKSAEADIVAALRAVARETATHGYAALVPASVSLPLPSLRLWARAVAIARSQQSAARGAGRAHDEAIILGGHAEGPAIAHARKGAHDPTSLIDARQLLDALIDRAHDWEAIRIVTFAPELRGADALIDHLVAKRIVASVGHSVATFEQATAAWDRGARSTTHLCNGMDPLHHRTPGVAGAALSHLTARVELICDGVHVDLRMAVLFAQLLGPRLIIISDACPAAGRGDGDFMLGTLPVRVKGSYATLADGTLAGAVSLVDKGVENLTSAGVDLATALVAATRTPADLLRSGEIGRLAPGSIARLIEVDGTTGALRRASLR